MKPDFAKGLLPVVAQDAATGEVLTVAYQNAEAHAKTLATGEMHYWSRSRGRLWRKGEESGNVQKLVALKIDCDGDALLALVEPAGPACHTGARSCFSNEESALHGDAEAALLDLARVLAARAALPKEGSHTSRLLSDENLRLKKLGEEAAEVVMAAKDRDRARLTGEIADLVYHALVVGQAGGVSARDVLVELSRRRR